MHNTPHSPHGRHGRPPSPLLVHPPFPSFAWVMTAQANPPTHAYANGYVQNAHAQARALTQMQREVQTRLPASHPAHDGCYWPYPRSTKSILPSPRPPASTPAEVSPAAPHEFMETVDYRYHDLPTRPYVPWRAALAPEKNRTQMVTAVPVPAASPSRAKRKSVLRALRRAFGLSKGTRPGRAA